METLAVRIRRARRLAGLSQGMVARRVGVKRTAVTQWEHPAGTCPSMDHLIQVAVLTGASFEWLATGRGSPQLDGELSAAAVATDDYARDALESHALAQLRTMPVTRRRLAVEVLDVLAR